MTKIWGWNINIIVDRLFLDENPRTYIQNLLACRFEDENCSYPFIHPGFCSSIVLLLWDFHF